MEYLMEHVLFEMENLVLQTRYVSFHSSAISEESYQK